MEKRIPRRRFKEFVGSGEWEEKKLGEVVDIYDGTHQTPNYTEEGIMFLSVENIKTLTSKKYISKQDFKKDFKVYPEKGDILMTRIGDVGTANVVKSSRPVAYYVSLALLKNNKLDSYFLKECIATKPVQMELWVRTLHIAFPKKINKNEIGNVSLPIPSLAEQEKIGHFFQKLDRLIDINKQKLGKLKASKSAYLTEMFPGEGEDRPRRRFQGFTGEWEENKFEDILDSSEGIRRGPFGSALKKDCFVKRSIYAVYEQKNAIEDKYDVRYYITKGKYDELSNFHLKPGDYIMSGAGTIGCISRVPKNIKKGVFNQALIRIRINDKLLNNNYFLIWMRSPNMQKRLTGANPASAMVNLVPMVELKQWNVLIPSLAEQEKIGDFFKRLDQQIEVQGEKLEKLEKMKKAYLAEMFV